MACRGDFAIQKNERQRFCAREFQKTFHNRVFGESLRMLCQIEALDLRPVLLGPIDVGRKNDQSMIDIVITYAAATA